MFDSIEEAGTYPGRPRIPLRRGAVDQPLPALRMERALKPDNIFLVKVNYWLNL